MTFPDINLNVTEGFGIIIGAVVTVIGGFVTTFFINRAKHRELKNAKAELDFQRYSLDFGQFLDEWEGTHKEILNLIETTKIDRFMILRAWNGENHPKWTTSVLQIRQGDQKPISYIHFELDSDYVDRIKALKINNHNYYLTKDLPPSSIKDVYALEGIKSSLWSLVGVSDVIDGKQAVTYCSFSTHEDEPLTPEEITKAKILVGRLKGIQNLFVERERSK